MMRVARQASPWRWLLALVAGGISVAGCGRNGDLPRSFYELERMAFVPAASSASLPGFLGRTAMAALPEPLLVDRFEVTRGDLAWYGLELPDPEEWSLEHSWQNRASSDWPASFSHAEAAQFARIRGMRLPYAHEWVHVAVGPRRHKYPWGSTDQRSTANTLELGLGRPLAVGTFESGRSEPFGCFDLLGNVWEWVADGVPGYNDLPWEDPTSPWRVSAMGGSFLSIKNETYGRSSRDAGSVAFHAVTLDPRHRAPDLGARCAIEARVFLGAFSDQWASVDREQLEEVGAGWGVDAVALLEELVNEPGAADALGALLEGARALQ